MYTNLPPLALHVALPSFRQPHMAPAIRGRSFRLYSFAQAVITVPFSGSKRTPCRSVAHAIRASFAASAKMTTLRCARDRRPRSHEPKGVACLERLGSEIGKAAWRERKVK